MENHNILCLHALVLLIVNSKYMGTREKFNVNENEMKTKHGT